jgi:hypothetical protein
MAQIITTNDQTIAVEPKNGKDFTLEEMQKIVGGYIECIYLPNKMIMIIDEEGKCKDKPINYAATTLYVQSGNCGESDYIAGDVLLCKSSQVK